MSRGQLSIEFLSLVIIGIISALIVLIGFVVVMQDSTEDQKSAQIKELGFEIQREIILASEVHEGYSRTFFVPEYIGKYNYEINSSDRIIILTLEDVDYPFRIPLVTGIITKGNNTIRKEGDEIIIEQ